jgi:hypothetical protein
LAPLLILHLLLPLSLLAWLGLAPLRTRLGFLVQLVATATSLLALHLVGLWLIPPWWTPWLYWVLFIIAMVRAQRTFRPQTLPDRPLSWIAIVLLLIFGLYAAWTAVQGFLGRQPPDQPAVEIRFPLDEGRYLVAHGGSNTTVNAHVRILARATPFQRHYYGQSHAVDIVAIDHFGLPAAGLNPSDPARYQIFGTRVVAPCNGQVLIVRGDLPDLQVPLMDRQNPAGNHMLLRCGKVDILLAHLRQGSLVVEQGQGVREGQLLGQVGNSGNTSMPHLHVHAQLPGTKEAPLSGRPIPIRIDGKYLVRGDRL